MGYIMLKKTLTPFKVREKIFNSEGLGTKFLHTLNHSHPHYVVSHIAGGGRSVFDTLVNVIHQKNGLRAFIMWWFSRLKFCISRLKYADKRHKWKEKVQKNTQFPFWGQTKASILARKLSFEEFDPVFFTADQSAWLVLNHGNRGSEVSEETWG